MELKSQDGALFNLRPLRYQFPGSSGGSRDWGSKDWDANWLIIRGHVTMTDGQSWCFEDPCLTTWEAHGIASWMHNVAAGRVAHSLIYSPDGSVFSFTEPNLAFSLEDHNAKQTRLRIHFSLESCPPWLAGSAQPDIFDFFVVFHVENEQLQHAATQWETELMPFPER